TFPATFIRSSASSLNSRENCRRSRCLGFFVTRPSCQGQCGLFKCLKSGGHSNHRRRRLTGPFVCFVCFVVDQDGGHWCRPVAEVIRPLIRLAARATFSRKGRRT